MVNFLGAIAFSSKISVARSPLNPQWSPGANPPRLGILPAKCLGDIASQLGYRQEGENSTLRFRISAPEHPS